MATFKLSGTLEYYKGKFLILEYPPGARFPIVQQLPDSDIRSMPREEFSAYITALTRFHEHFWTGSEHYFKSQEIRARIANL